MITFAFWTLFALLLFVSLILTLLVLIQKGRGGGLSSAFGGGGGGSTAFGAKTGDVLTWATSIVFGVFMILAVGLSLVGNARQHQLDNATGQAGQTQQPVPGSNSPAK
ncbi:MAG TPA: preprotein translocase subunit SecG [Tepidisphaeraceae bacterium]|nr:preprotein translocase subunit SecG [Tepidisphaeraceae bacterium]